MEVEEDRLECDGHVRDLSRRIWNAVVMIEVRLGRSEIIDVETDAIGESGSADNDRRSGERLMLARRIDVVDCAVKLIRHSDDVSGAVGHSVNGAEENAGPTGRRGSGNDAVIEESVGNLPVSRIVAAEKRHRFHCGLNGAVKGEVTFVT